MTLYTINIELISKQTPIEITGMRQPFPSRGYGEHLVALIQKDLYPKQIPVICEDGNDMRAVLECNNRFLMADIQWRKCKINMKESDKHVITDVSSLF